MRLGSIPYAFDRMTHRLRLLLHPVPDHRSRDTSLRYTDILFGFVIRELFLRLQNWSQIDFSVRWHLVVGTALVIGSWIGYRRSLNRSTYEVKFFNLPLFRFLTDQLMLILYFRIAVLTRVDGSQVPPPAILAIDTLKLVLQVFVLYAVWDLLGIWMAKANLPSLAGEKAKPRYPVVRDDQKTDDHARSDWAGLWITVLSGGGFLALWFSLDRLDSNWVFVIATALLLAYRWAKEVRTSWRLG